MDPGEDAKRETLTLRQMDRLRRGGGRLFSLGSFGERCRSLHYQNSNCFNNDNTHHLLNFHPMPTAFHRLFLSLQKGIIILTL